MELDPNKKLEENLKQDGEFLRDVDKGHTPTETGFDIDLGIVRDDHAEVMDELAEVDASTNQPGPLVPGVPDVADHFQPSSAAAPEPSPTDPFQQPDPTDPDPTDPFQWEAHRPDPSPAPPQPQENLQAEHGETIGQMERIAKPSAAKHAAIPDKPKSADESKPGSPPARPAAAFQAEHAQTMVEMGRAIHRERQGRHETPVPVTADPAELERLTFPGEQHQTAVRSSMEAWIREQREWNAAVTELFWEQAELLRQARLELDQIRGYLERIPL